MCSQRITAGTISFCSDDRHVDDDQMLVLRTDAKLSFITLLMRIKLNKFMNTISNGLAHILTIFFWKVSIHMNTGINVTDDSSIENAVRLNFH